jgi:hypothetical protein
MRGSIGSYVCDTEHCTQRGIFSDVFRWDKDPPPRCPLCGMPQRRAEHNFHQQQGCDYAQPILSESMGVAPSQVEEHRRARPDIPLTDDGRVIIRSHEEGKRIRKALGFFDKSGYTR